MFNTEDVTVLLAAAGAGKTTYLLDCVEKDLQTYRPQELSFVSYTRKGAYEGKDRIVRRFNIDPDQLDYFRTLHSLTFRELGRDENKVFTQKHVKKFNEIFGMKIGNPIGNEAKSRHDKMLSYYDSVRAGKVDIYEDTGIPNFSKAEYDRFINAYEGYKREFGIIDYTDSLELFVKRGKSIPVKVAYIDEAQDLTSLQWKVCLTAFQDAEKIYIAGDDYQSIYTYAGAKPQVLVQLSEKYRTVKLETSYRLPKKVYKIARAVTEMIGMKVEKDYVPFKDEDGVVERINSYSQIANKVAIRQEESWLMLFRNNYHISFFEKELQSHAILYHNSRGFCIGRGRMQLLNKYYNFRKLGFGDEKTKALFAKEYGITDFDNDIVESELIKGEDKYVIQHYIDKYGIHELKEAAKREPNIMVSTIHKVKGAEAKNVAVFLDCTMKVAKNLTRNFDSELRVLYVAMTRAKDNLYLVRSRANYGLDSLVDVLMEYAEL